MTSQSLALFSLFFLIICHHVRAKIVFQVERPLINIDFDKADKLYGSGDKYFWESHFNNHYDGRYTDHEVSDEERADYLRTMIQAYFEKMSGIGVESWIMHGSLLGWWWNQKIMPWDNDLDVQVSEASLWFLWDNYNFSEYDFTLPDGSKRRFILEINPNFRRRHERDSYNVIDARWIDTTSGLFIDLTAVRKDYKAMAMGQKAALMCKDKHTFVAEDIFPLRRTTFEGFGVNVPFAYTKLLREEYGDRALTNTRFSGYNFNQTTREWDLEPKSEEQRKKEQEKARIKEEKQQRKNQHVS